MTTNPNNSSIVWRNHGISLKDIDFSAPAVEVSDIVLERIQETRSDLNFDEQMDLLDHLVLGNLR